ncbi:MAG: glycerophosphoryl diester phosphodiesterase membrane domain-containing protein [Sphingomicrobium sp.]
MTEQLSLKAGQVLGAMIVETTRNMAVAAVAVAGLTAIDLVSVQLSIQGSMIISGMASLTSQYFVTRFALDRAGLLPAGFTGRFGSFWGMNIVTNLATVLGLLLLIVPGLYLAARWFIAAPSILAEDRTAGEGMGESWERMKGSVWHVLAAILVLYLSGFGLAMAPQFFVAEDNLPMALQIFSSFASSVTIVLGWLMAVGAYRLTVQPEESLAEIFA